MDLIVIHRDRKLLPAHIEDFDALANVPQDRMLRAKVTAERNLAHHRKFMTLVNRVRDNHPSYTSTEQALVAVKLAAGWCDWVPNPMTGEYVPVPKSISFASMDQTEFNAFYNAAIAGVLEHLLPGMGLSPRRHDQVVDAIARY